MAATPNPVVFFDVTLGGEHLECLPAYCLLVPTFHVHPFVFSPLHVSRLSRNLPCVMNLSIEP